MNGRDRMNKKKKICFAITSITDNGVTRVVSILLDHIDYSKYDVSVLLTRKVPRKRTLNEKARIIEVTKDICSGLLGKFRNVSELHGILKKENFDVIIALGDYAAMYVLLACRGIRAKKIVSERNDPNREPEKKVFRKLRDKVYKKADMIVCQTNDAAAYFSDIVKQRVIIHNPISENLPVSDRKKVTKRIVNFCRVDKQKNLELLIDAFGDFAEKHPDYSLEIYGNGPEKQNVEAYAHASAAADRIVLKDFCLNIHDEIKQAAMFVSSSDFEGMSNSMLEAMGIGLPTICTDCPIGGAHEIIQSGENGILVPVGDKKAMSEAMSRVSDDKELADRLSESAVKIRDTLSHTKICEQWWALIDEF